jgi:hypothetical protein
VYPQLVSVSSCLSSCASTPIFSVFVSKIQKQNTEKYFSKQDNFDFSRPPQIAANPGGVWKEALRDTLKFTDGYTEIRAVAMRVQAHNATYQQCLKHLFLDGALVTTRTCSVDLFADPVGQSAGMCTYVYDDVTYVYDDVTM